MPADAGKGWQVRDGSREYLSLTAHSLRGARMAHRVTFFFFFEELLSYSKGHTSKLFIENLWHSRNLSVPSPS